MLSQTCCYMDGLRKMTAESPQLTFPIFRNCLLKTISSLESRMLYPFSKGPQTKRQLICPWLGCNNCSKMVYHLSYPLAFKSVVYDSNPVQYTFCQKAPLAVCIDKQSAVRALFWLCKLDTNKFAQTESYTVPVNQHKRRREVIFHWLSSSRYRQTLKEIPQSAF